MEICNKGQCSGCFACYNSCAIGAITMHEDTIGHIYPVIDEQLCVSCGVCKKICPANKPITKTEPQKVYAAWVLEEEEHKKSSSGGLGHYFAKKTLELGGVVYGCSSIIKEEKLISHVRCDTIEGIEQLRGSKYVHSFINDAFRLVKNDLKENSQVLFIGTPCQIAGLKSYLQKDYDNLLTVDLVCHGVPPQKLFFEHLKDLKIEDAKNVSFRDNISYVLSLNNERTEIKTCDMDDLYYVGFNKSLFLRESCYQCKYAIKERAGDITLGDFWGIGKETPFDTTKKTNPYGISLCMVNTQKGQLYIEQHKNGLFLEERTLQEAVNGNSNLRKPRVPHKNKESFVVNYEKKGFKKAAKKALRFNFFKYKILKIINKSKLLQKIFNKIY